MSKNTRLNAASVVLFMAAICLVCVGGTHTPWDGTAWDITSPDIDQLTGNHYKEMFDLRKGVAIRMNKEHETLATASAGGVHTQGSARAFFQDAAPTTQINGDAWDSGDTGSLWFDTNSSPDNLVYVLTDHASTGTWTLLSVSMTAEIVAAAHSWADVQTFDLQTVHTLGILSNADITLGADDDLVGSATSTINMNAFDVDENGVATLGTSLNIASTVVVVGTIDDDTMGTATADTIGSTESIKAYVDLDSTGSLMHDAEGGFSNLDVNGTKTKVYTKYLTGTLSAGSTVNVAHGVTAANILSVTAIVNDGTSYRVSEIFRANITNLEVAIKYDATNINFEVIGSELQENAYRIKIEYTI